MVLPPPVSDPETALYPLIDVHFRARMRRVVAKGKPFWDAHSLGLDVGAICDCLMALAETDFSKRMEHEKQPGLWLDVYLVTFDGRRLYVKFFCEDDMVKMVSFHRENANG